MTATPTCTYPRCRRKTKDATGRCQDHRAKGLVTTTAPSPIVTTPLPNGRGKRVVNTQADGFVREEWSDDQGLLHREDGPAVRGIDADGTVLYESYYRRGDQHRVDGPAEITYHHSGATASEHYYFHGDPHRIGGPALSGFEEDGTPYGENYALQGMYFNEERLLLEMIRSDGAERARDHLRDSPYHPLIDSGVDPGKILDVLGEGVRSVDGIRAVLEGAPVEWARSFEEGRA